MEKMRVKHRVVARDRLYLCVALSFFIVNCDAVVEANPKSCVEIWQTSLPNFSQHVFF